MQQILSVKSLVNHPVFIKLLKDHPCLIPDDFNWKIYLKANPDLMDGGLLSNECEAQLHYILFGKAEYRLYSKQQIKSNKKMLTKKNKDILKQYNFDPKIYKILNVDLSYFDDIDASLHFINHGIKENRSYRSDYLYNKIIKTAETNLKKLHETKIVLINHDSSITGAPKALINIYNYLKENDYDVLFIDVIPNKFIQIDNIAYHLNDINRLKIILDKTKPNIIYSNSLNIYLKYCSYFMEYLNNTIFYFHETYSGFDHFTQQKYNILLKNFPIYVVTNKIQKEFNENGFMNVDVSPPFLPVSEQQQIDQLKNETIIDPIYNIKSTRKLDNKKIILGMCGTPCKRKNFTLFASLAIEHPNYEFVWIGANKEQIDENFTNIDNLFLINKTMNPYKYFNILDYFFLTSLSDPCPFVVLENLYLNNKIIVLDKNIHYNHPVNTLENYIVIYNHNNDVKTISDYFKKLNLNKQKNKTQKNINYIKKQFSSPKIIGKFLTNNKP